MRRKDLKPAMLIALSIMTLGILFTAFSVLSTRMAYQRAYTEIASNCRRITLLTVDDVRYLCAPVSRVERAGPADPAATGPVTRL